MDLIPSWLWFIAGLGFLIIELNTASFFFGIVGFGALLASFVDFFVEGELASFVTFVFGTGLAAFLAWKLDIYSTSQETLKTGPDRLIDQVGTVEEKIDEVTGEGIVIVDGEKWRAKSDYRLPIPKGDRVKVVNLEGTQLVVRPLEGEELENG